MSDQSKDVIRQTPFQRLLLNAESAVFHTNHAETFNVDFLKALADSVKDRTQALNKHWLLLFVIIGLQLLVIMGVPLPSQLPFFGAIGDIRGVEELILFIGGFIFMNFTSQFISLMFLINVIRKCIEKSHSGIAADIYILRYLPGHAETAIMSPHQLGYQSGSRHRFVSIILLMAIGSIIIVVPLAFVAAQIWAGLHALAESQIPFFASLTVVIIAWLLDLLALLKLVLVFLVKFEFMLPPLPANQVER